jgi:hypothetical protein
MKGYTIIFDKLAHEIETWLPSLDPQRMRPAAPEYEWFVQNANPESVVDVTQRAYHRQWDPSLEEKEL